MTTTEECRFPEWSPNTAYKRGCRCDRCRADASERARRWYQANRDKELERGRDYYTRNRREVLEAHREWRDATVEQRAAKAKQDRARYKARTPATVTGPYSKDEDDLIADWTGDVVSLAIALGRDYDSVGWRINKLRKFGCTLARDQHRHPEPPE